MEFTTENSKFTAEECAALNAKLAEVLSRLPATYPRERAEQIFVNAVERVTKGLI